MSRLFAARRREIDRVGARFLAVLLGIGALAFSTAARWPGVAMASCWSLPIVIVVWIGASEASSPNCANSTRSPVGPYCPACGARSLGRRGWWPRHECAGCGVVIRSRRRYRAHFCSHCGVLLDERGF